MPVKKTYHHRVSGARFILPDGREICFAGGYFSTDQADIQAELDKIANVPASQVYTTAAPIKGMEEGQLAAELRQGATRAFDDINKIVGPAETVPIPVPADPKPTLQGSGVASALDRAKAAVQSAGPKKG